MNPRYLPIIDALELSILFVGLPAIWALIGYAAWNGKPNGFDRAKFGSLAIAAGAAAFFLFVHAQRMHADVRTPMFFVQLTCFMLGVLLFGIAGGFMLGVVLYRRGLGDSNRAADPPTFPPPASD